MQRRPGPFDARLRAARILVLSTLWALVLTGAACVTSSRAGGGGGGGNHDSGTAQPGTGGGAGGAAGGDRTCSMTPSGCFCLQGTDPGLASCNTTSVVKNSGEQGTCCDDGNGFCKCDAYACKSNPTTKICECGTSVTVGTEVTSGSLVAECPAPTGNQICCLTTDTSGNPLCVCSAADCQGAMTVSTCTIARVAVCPDAQQSVTSCK